MNLNMIRPKNETENQLLTITKNCETLIEQTHRKAEETLEFKMNKSRETFHFKPPIQIKGDWMIGLTDLEVYNSIFNITEENNKFELYKFPDEKAGGVTYEKVRDEIEKDLDIEDITAEDLQDDIIGLLIIEEYNEQVTKRMNDEQYMNIIAIYTRSVFQDFESFLRTQIDLVEDDIKLVLDEYNSNFVTYELVPGIYSYRDMAEALYYILQSEYPSSGSEILIRLDDIHLKCDAIDGSVVNGIRQPILYSFVLDKPAGYKVFSEPETIHYKKINKSVLNTITFYLEDDNNKEINFNGETLTFTLQMIKI